MSAGVDGGQRDGLWTPDGAQLSAEEKRLTLPSQGPELGRRRFIQRAGAAGVVGWAAPLIVDSMVAPAAAQTLAQVGCFRYQYNWWLEGTTPGSGVPDEGTVADEPHNLMRKVDDVRDPDATWHEECQPSDDDGIHLAGKSVAPPPENKGYFSNQSSANNQCCKDGTINPYDWFENDAAGGERNPTFPTPDCITISPTCGSAGTGDGFNNGQSITFDLSGCGDCQFADPEFMYTSNTGSLSIALAAQGGRRSQTITINFPGSHLRWPIYLKVWIGCGPNSLIHSCNADAIVFSAS